MLTYQCKVILKKLKQLTNNTECEISFLGNTTLFCLSDDYNKTCDYSKYKDEIHSIVSHLASNGYLCFGSNEYCFSLTHKGVHNKQLTYVAIGKFLLHNIIAIIALLVGIVGLLSDLGLIAIELAK